MPGVSPTAPVLPSAIRNPDGAAAGVFASPENQSPYGKVAANFTGQLKCLYTF